MTPLRFRVAVPDPANHRIAVTMEIDSASWPDGPRDLFLPVWTPGSYMVREYSRHIEEFTAHDAQTGAPIAWRKTAKNRFRLSPSQPDATGPGAPASSGQAIEVRYAVYAHELTVRTADVTEDHAFWNGACVFLWPVGAPTLTATIEITAPDSWTIHTPLPRDADGTYRARGLDELVDMPALLGTPEVLAFEALGKPHEFVLDGLAGLPTRASLVPDTIRIIEAAAAVFGGGLPYEKYQFLSLFAESGHGGLEHRDSSVLLAPRTTFHDDKAYQNFMGLVAHEFFHVWNVKRMRPANLWTFDYESECHTTLLWVAEGFTAYYDDLLCRRANILSRDRYLEILAENIGNLTRNPGREVHPLSAASFDAWIKLYRPDENTRNSTQSYYTNGALTALCLDLHIREASNGTRSLDDAVRALYETTFARGRGYDLDDVRACLSAAAGEDLTERLATLVDGPFDPDFEAVFARVGLRLVRSVRSGLYMGVVFKSDTMVLHSVLRDGPAARGGLAPGDEILGVGGLRVDAAGFKSLLEQVAEPDTPIECAIARRGRLMTRTVTPTTHPRTATRIKVVEDADERVVALRRGWLAE